MYERAGDTIRIELKMMQTMEQLSEYGELVDNLLDYIEQGVLMKFSAMNHFSYAFLADLFQVSPICTLDCYASLHIAAYRTKAQNSVIHVYQRG